MGKSTGFQITWSAQRSGFAHQTPQLVAACRVGKLTEFEILLSEVQHLPTLPHSQWEGGQIDRIRDIVVRG
ncbi:MAG: hypothetical protein F6J98_30055 [Moorea sp. SIO4G2]|uniref:hypothetical protein n=1 Tax=Moorena sp. SIO3I6 TaxID=2607831 RepID=UPI0013F81B22|nr:hypothetical protein [Moorena sp. SIO3I6]NEO64425.1 hypothetical protein [Moorena sp. SIO4G2]